MVALIVRKISAFYRDLNLIPVLQDTAIGRCPEPDESSLHQHCAFKIFSIDLSQCSLFF
jgi:hypothetical protein